MKHKKSEIGKWGIRWKPVEGYTTKKGKRIAPHWKKEEFNWKDN
jgi:hypothetical protein